MALKLHIRKNDVVVAVAGSDAAVKGKTGKVLQVFPERGKAIVEGMHYVRKHLRRSPDRPKGDIIAKESPIAISNLMLWCPHCKKGVRIARVPDGKGGRARKCRKCGHLFG